MSQSISGLEHFRRLNGSVLIHEPTSSTSTTSSAEPDLILIYGWMGARPKHVAKYTAGYEKMYPSARILLAFTSPLDSAFHTWAANYKRVDPILEILGKLPPKSKLLVHVFSDGGSFTATMIAKRFKEKMGSILPTAALILDSTPGKATLEGTVRAFSAALPKNPVARLLGILGIRAGWWLYRIYYLLRSLWMVNGHLNVIEWSRKELNDKSVMDADTPRLYIYSESDATTPWQLVEEHIKEAGELGYLVDREKYFRSAHCGHLVLDPKRYWAAVGRVWSRVSIPLV